MLKHFFENVVLLRVFFLLFFNKKDFTQVKKIKAKLHLEHFFNFYTASKSCEKVKIYDKAKSAIKRLTIFYIYKMCIN